MPDHYLKDKFKIIYFELGVVNEYRFKLRMSENRNNFSFLLFCYLKKIARKQNVFLDYMNNEELHIPHNIAKVIKGLNQDTLFPFIQNNKDCLNSTTTFELTQLYLYLNSRYIILLDEFNVSLHKFKVFTKYIEFIYFNLIILSLIMDYFYF